MIDADFWEAFQTARLPAAEWTHVAHLRAAWLHLQRYPFDEAHLRLRASIILLNASHGIVESPARGYHETLTRAWLALVAGARSQTPAIDGSALFVAAHAPRLARDALLRHYSRERLFSVAARSRFVEPDRAPLPAPSPRLEPDPLEPDPASPPPSRFTDPGQPPPSRPGGPDLRPLPPGP